MLLSRILLSAFATLFLASAAFAGDTPVAPPMGMQAGFGPGLCRGVMRYLTPEERVMHWQEVQNAIRLALIAATNAPNIGPCRPRNGRNMLQVSRRNGMRCPIPRK